MRQDRSARVATRRAAPRGVDDGAVLSNQDEIAAPSHRFYNERNFVVLAGGVALFAVQLEHSLQGRLAKRTNPRVAQVLARGQRERGVVLQAASGQIGEPLYARLFRVRGQQHERAAGAWRETFHGEAYFVCKDQALDTGTDKQVLELIADCRQR